MGFYKYNCNRYGGMSKTAWFVGGCLASCGVIVAYNTFAGNAYDDTRKRIESKEKGYKEQVKDFQEDQNENVWPSTKIAVVDYNEIAFSLPEYDDIRRRIESKEKGYKEQVEDFQRAQNEYENERGKMSEEAKSEAEKKLKKLFMEIREKQQTLEKEIENEIKPIREKSKNAVSGFAKRKGIDVVLDIVDTTLVNGDLNITEKVKEELKKKNESKKR